MTKKLTPSHIAVAVAAGLTAQTALAQTPPAPQPTGGSGQEITPMIKLDNNQYSGQGFFEKPSSVKKAASAPVVPKVEEKAAKPVVDNAPSVAVSPVPSANAPAAPAASAPVANKTPIKDPMLPLDIVGSKDAKENTKGGLTPPLAKKDTPAAPAVAASGLKKPDALLATPTTSAAVVATPAASAPKAPVVAATPAPVASAPVVVAKPPVANPTPATPAAVAKGVPPAAIPMVASPAPVVTPPTVAAKAPAAKAPAEKVATETTLDKTETLVKPAPAVVAKKKAPVAKKTVVAKKPVVEAPFDTVAKQAVPVEVKELPSAGAPVAPALYAAEPTTPIIVTEVVRIDSISLQAPTIAEQETQPLPRLPEPEPIVAAIVPAPLPAPVVTPPAAAVVAPAPAPFVAPTVVAQAPAASVPFIPVPYVAPAPVSAPVAPAPFVAPTAPPAPSAGRVDVPMASASMDDLPSLDAPSVDTIRSNSRLHPRPPAAVVAQAPVAPAARVSPPVVQAKPPIAAPVVQVPAPAPVVIAAAPVRAAPQENRDARIQALLDELKTLQSNPIVVQSVQPPVEVVAPHHVAVPKIDPAATIQLPLPEEPRPLIKPTPKEPARMVTEHAPKAAVDVPQTAAIDAPRTMTTAPVLEPRVHRVANPKFVGLPEKGDFIAFMPGSSHVSEETVESLRSMVDVFKQHGIRKIVLTGTALRDEDTENMESSDFAQKRAKNLKAAFQRAGFKGVIALDDPKRARPGTTPRVGLVALQ